MGVPDVGQINTDQSGLVAIGGAAHVDDAGIAGIDGYGLVVIALRELGGPDNGKVRQADVVGGDGRVGQVALVGLGGNADLGPVLAEVLGHEDPVEGAGGGRDDRIEPAFVNGVLGGVAGRVGHGQGDPPLSAGGGQAVDGVDVGAGPITGVEDQGVADTAKHLVPDLSLVGAHEDAHAADGGVDDLEVALDFGIGVGVKDRAALLIEDHGGGLPGHHQLPGLARVLTAPDAAGGAAQGGIDDHLAGGRGLGINGDRKAESPTNTRSRLAELIGRTLPLESTLSVLS